MTIRTHTHIAPTAHTACTATTAHIHRTGYATARGADTYAATHTAPVGRTYVPTHMDAPSGTGADVHAVMCVPAYTDADDNALTDRYGVNIITVDNAHSFVGDAYGMGYASVGTNTYGAPTVPATDDTPTFYPDDTTDADIDPTTGTTYADAMAVNDTVDALAYMWGDDITPTDDIPTYGIDNPPTIYPYRDDRPVPTGAPTAPSTDITTDTAPSTPTPGRTYTGTSHYGIDYTMFYDGTITTRTYTTDDGTFTAYTDSGYMWVPYGDGTCITYVVAEGTFWHTHQTADDMTPTTSASWPMAATCGHSFGGYGACIAPTGHPHAHHIDANGNKFTGRAMTRYGTPIGPMAPDTMIPATDPNTPAASTPTAVLRTHLHDGTYTVSAMVACALHGNDPDTYDTVTHADTMAAYRLIVCAMGASAYINTPDTYPHTIYTAMLDASAIAPTYMAAMWTDVLRTV